MSLRHMHFVTPRVAGKGSLFRSLSPRLASISLRHGR